VSSTEFEDDLKEGGEQSNQPGEDNDSLANKLSKELTNWRRKRTSSRPKHTDGPRLKQNFQSEPARTIKVRGHETLVVRKPKLVSKTASDTDQTPSD
jgi:hypothetical protein